jgi:hypothetical protein
VVGADVAELAAGHRLAVGGVCPDSEDQIAISSTWMRFTPSG